MSMITEQYAQKHFCDYIQYYPNIHLTALFITVQHNPQTSGLATPH